MRHGKVLQNLLRHLGKNRRGDGGAIVSALGRIEDHGHGDHRVVDRRNAHKRGDVHRLRVEMCGRVDLLRRAGLAARGVTVELRRLAGTVENHAFHHLAHLRRGHGRDHAMRARRQRIGQLAAGLEWRCLRCGQRLFIVRSINLPRHQHARRQVDAAIGDRRNH